MMIMRFQFFVDEKKLKFFSFKNNIQHSPTSLDANAIFRPSQPFASWSNVDTVGSGKGGSAIPPLTLSRWAWEARLLPKRVDLFRRLLGEDDICVGLDSVHWDTKGERLCSMASFTKKEHRSLAAFKIECVAAASGLWRTTHWGSHGDLSRYCYGDRYRKEAAYQAVNKEWFGWAANEPAMPAAQPTTTLVRSSILERAEKMTVEEAKALIKTDILTFL
jgi:hypothetical protein